MAQKESDGGWSFDSGPEVEILDPNFTRKVLVSSSLLGLASPVFAALFSPRFSEGTKIVETECPEITLSDDDPNSMLMILRALHFREPMIDRISSRQLAVLALHCDNVQWIPTAEVYGHLLLAAHFFRAADEFSDISCQAKKNLASCFFSEWKSLETLSLLPERFKRDLLNEIKQLLDLIHNDLQRVASLLFESKRYYKMVGLQCSGCGRTHPSSAGKCHSCIDTELYPKYCSREYRVAQYFSALRKPELWPSIDPFKNLSALVLAWRVSSARLNLEHHCSMGNGCPLRMELEMLIKNVGDRLKSSRELVLYPLHDSGIADS
ncbi:hypothetical protein FQN57_006589 [Myotisia sp. PD_48]|nr:hypothetical protein FQN57_006589 [Myotisia sp. PD_48]